MIFLKRSFLLFLLMAFAQLGHSNDSIQANSFNSLRLIAFDNLWLKTSNSSGLYFNGPLKIVSFDLSRRNQSGEFHRISEAQESTNYLFNTQSYLPLGDKIFTSGSFEYNKSTEKGARWSGTFDPYRGNPYLLADSVSGAKWLKESYRLNGQMAFIASEKMVFGFNVDYFAAVGVKQKDPRPKVLVTSFVFNPSALFIRPTYQLGFDLGYTNRKEEIDYQVKRSNFTPTYFNFKGMGFFSKELEQGNKRFQFYRDFFGGLQLQKKLNAMQSLTEFRAKYTFEGIEDGSNTISKEDGGDWQTFDIRLNEYLQKKNGNHTNIFSGKFGFTTGEGTEYTQTKVTEGDFTRYITIAKNLKYKRQTFSGEISYNFLKMLNKSQVDWDIQSSVTTISNQETYYYIPEIFSASYLNVAGNAAIQKNFYFGKFHLAPGFNAQYNSNFSGKYDLSSLSEITNSQRQDVFISDFNYYTTDFLKIGGKLQLGYSSEKLKTVKQVYFSIDYDQWKPIDVETSATWISARIGFVL